MGLPAVLGVDALTVAGAATTGADVAAVTAGGESGSDSVEDAGSVSPGSPPPPPDPKSGNPELSPDPSL
ncbi:hypothetical protein ABFW09_29100, partial [Mycolicibacterium fortuitum]